MHYLKKNTLNILTLEFTRSLYMQCDNITQEKDKGARAGLGQKLGPGIFLAQTGPLQSGAGGQSGP